MLVFSTLNTNFHVNNSFLRLLIQQFKHFLLYFQLAIQNLSVKRVLIVMEVTPLKEKLTVLVSSFP